MFLHPVLSYNNELMMDSMPWLGCFPTQDSSHHQDFYIFRLGDAYLAALTATVSMAAQGL